MAYIQDGCLVVGISARALFDMDLENNIFEKEGLEAYRAYQIAHEEEVLRPGPCFSLIRSLLEIDRPLRGKKRVEVILMSHNDADVSLRLFRSIEHYGLSVVRAVFSGGSTLVPYLQAFGADLFLSANETEVCRALECGIAGGIVCTDSAADYGEATEPGPIRIAFDGDAVLFSDEAEEVFRKQGLAAFEESERRRARCPLKDGPLANFLRVISSLQRELAGTDTPIRTALVTARCAPAHERVVRTLRGWGVRIDESFFLGGLSKKEVLRAFGAQIFFDDQEVNLKAVSEAVPAARVPVAERVLTGQTQDDWSECNGVQSDHSGPFFKQAQSIYRAGRNTA
ncbi:MAG TPA: 5'-nucleotidase [Candidatus Eisenbergiella pullicola]|nr:5'-nucleotidase [Candidatus Eisenbergiella pullicola]